MVLINKDVHFSAIEVTLLHYTNVTDYLFFFQKRHIESLTYDPENKCYRTFIPFSAEDEVPLENIDKYILRQTNQAPSNHDIKTIFEYSIRMTFNTEKEYKDRIKAPLEKEYLSVYDILSIFLVCHTEPYDCQYDFTDLLVNLIKEVYIPLTPERYHKSIISQTHSLRDICQYNKEIHAQLYPNEWKTMTFNNL